MKTSKIKAPILIPLTIAIFLLVGAFAYSSFNAQYAEHEIGIAEQVQTAYAVLETQIRADAASMSAAIEVLARNPELQSAWLARDRKTLLALSSDIATRLWGEHRVTHFYFHDANRVNFLRVHDPERLGGPIERETLKTAVEYSQPYHGLEIGESGTLTLRTVHPWRIGGKITGYIELGEEIVQIAEKLSDTLGIDLFVLIDKKFLDRAKWERGMRRLGRNPDWDRAASAVVVTGTLPEALEGLAGVIEDEGSARPGLSPPALLSVTGRKYLPSPIPLKDVSGKVVGRIVLLHDVTHFYSGLNKSFYAFGAAALFIGVGLFGLFFFILNRVEDQLDSAQAGLIKEGKRAAERASRLATMQDLNRQIAENLELNESLDGIVRAAMELLKADYARIFLLDEKKQELVLQASHGRRAIPSGRVASLKIGESVTGWASRSERPLLIPDVLEDPRWKAMPWEWVPQDEIRAFISQPLNHQGQSIGFINCMSRDEDYFTGEDLELLGTFASQAAVAIERARLLTETRERAARLEIVDNIAKTVGSTLEPEALFRTVTREIRRAVPCERCIIASVDEDTHHFHFWHTESDIEIGQSKFDDSLAEWLIQDLYQPNRPLHVRDNRESPIRQGQQLAKAGLLNTLFVPIPRDGRCVAHMALSSSRLDAFSAEEIELLTSVAGHLGPALRNATLYQRAESRAARLATLQELNRQIAENLDLQGTLDNIVRAVSELLNGDLSRIFLYDEATENVTLRAYFGRIAAPPRGTVSFKPGEGIIGRLLQTGEAVIVPDLDDDPLWMSVEWSRKYGFHSYLVYPLRQGGKIIGVINCLSCERNFFTREDLDLLGTFASQAAVAIQNASLYREAEDRTARLATLQELNRQIAENLDLQGTLDNIVDAAAGLLSGNASRIFLLDEASEVISLRAVCQPEDAPPPVKTSFRLGEGVIGQVVQKGEAVVLADIQEEPSWGHPEWAEKTWMHAFIGHPLRQGEKIIGAINCLSCERNFFSREDLDLLGILASQAAVAIQNARLHEEESRSRLFLQSVVGDNADAIIVGDAERRIIIWNKGAEKLYGYTAEEMLGQKTADWLVPEDQSAQRERAWAEINRTGEAVTIETVRLRKDGTRIPVLLTRSPIKDASGNITAVTGITKDLTERYRMEAALRESEERHRTLLEQQPHGIVLVREGKFVFSNPALREMTGFSEADLRDRSPTDFVASEDKEKAEQRIRDLFAGAPPEPTEYRAVRKDGSYFPAEVLSRLIMIDGEKTLLSTIRDLTERNRMEAALRESEELHRSLLELMPDAVGLVTDGKIAYANPAYHEMLGYTPEEVQNIHPADFVAPEDQEKLKNRMQEIEAGGGITPAEYRLIRKDRSTIHTENRSRLIQAGGKPTVLSIIRDITDRKQIEKEREGYIERLNTFGLLQQKISASLEFDEVMGFVVESAAELLDVPFTRIFILREDKLNLEHVHGGEMGDVQNSRWGKGGSAGPRPPARFATSRMSAKTTAGSKWIGRSKRALDLTLRFR